MGLKSQRTRILKGASRKAMDRGLRAAKNTPWKRKRKKERKKEGDQA
jgi:hypothetical protein